jgi:hypothetical protein
MAHRCREAAARDQAVKEVDRGGQENGNRHFGLPLLHSRIRANQDVAGVAPLYKGRSSWTLLRSDDH